jgi:hypothetical protein
MASARGSIENGSSNTCARLRRSLGHSEVRSYQAELNTIGFEWDPFELSTRSTTAPRKFMWSRAGIAKMFIDVPANPSLQRTGVEGGRLVAIAQRRAEAAAAGR